MALCCGTNVVFNRQALTKIGGWGTISVTEDVLTSYLLNGNEGEEEEEERNKEEEEEQRNSHNLPSHH